MFIVTTFNKTLFIKIYENTSKIAFLGLQKFLTAVHFIVKYVNSAYISALTRFYYIYIVIVLTREVIICYYYGRKF